jgi:hypothetical protein
MFLGYYDGSPLLLSTCYKCEVIIVSSLLSGVGALSLRRYWLLLVLYSLFSHPLSLCILLVVVQKCDSGLLIGLQLVEERNFNATKTADARIS